MIYSENSANALPKSKFSLPKIQLNIPSPLVFDVDIKRFTCVLEISLFAVRFLMECEGN